MKSLSSKESDDEADKTRRLASQHETNGGGHQRQQEPVHVTAPFQSKERILSTHFVHDGRVRLTEAGFLLSDSLFVELL